MSRAKDNPVFTSTETDVRDMSLPQSQSGILTATGSAEDLRQDFAHENTVLSVSDGVAFDEYAQELAFNEQVLTVIVHKTNDKNAEHLVKLGCNGRNQFLIRGVKLQCKRSFVESLARAKPVEVTTHETVDIEGGRAIRVDRVTNVAYPFSVLHDPAGAKGEAWLAKIVAED